jgi:hypothetical protein
MVSIFRSLAVLGFLSTFALAQNNTGTNRTTPPRATGQPPANPNGPPERQHPTQSNKHKKMKKGTASKSNSNGKETPNVNDSNMGSSHGTGASQQDPGSAANTRTGEEPRQNPPQQATPSNPPQQ